MGAQSDAAPRARVAVDALGGDHGLAVVVEGGAAREPPPRGRRCPWWGPSALLRRGARPRGRGRRALEVVDAPEAVGMAEKVSLATLKKRSSIQVALERVRDGQADAFFSAGNTAACWTIARRVLGTLEEVDRPALAALVPNRDGRTVVIDVGANAQCKARHLEEFAIMGERLRARRAGDRPAPRRPDERRRGGDARATSWCARRTRCSSARASTSSATWRATTSSPARWTWS